MTRATLLLASVALIVSSCDATSTGPVSLDGPYTLVAENDVPLPSDQGNSAGCCLGGGGEGFPHLLGAGTVSPDNSTVTLRYGDEGPGSNQIRATFRR